MRIAVFIIAVLGGLATGALGAKWFSDVQTLKSEVEAIREKAKTDPAVKEKADKIDRLTRTIYVLIGAAVLTFVSAFLVLQRRGLIAGLIMLVCGVAPYLTSQMPEIFVFTGLTILAGLLALLVRPRPTPADRDDDYGRSRRGRDDYDDEDREERGRSRGRREED